MDRTIASRILAGALALDKAYGDLDTAVSGIPDETERQVYAKRLGEIIGKVNDTFIRPIVRQYPDLDPEK